MGVSKSWTQLSDFHTHTEVWKAKLAFFLLLWLPVICASLEVPLGQVLGSLWLSFLVCHIVTGGG